MYEDRKATGRKATGGKAKRGEAKGKKAVGEIMRLKKGAKTVRSLKVDSSGTQSSHEAGQSKVPATNPGLESQILRTLPHPASFFFRPFIFSFNQFSSHPTKRIPRTPNKWTMISLGGGSIHLMDTFWKHGPISISFFFVPSD